MRTPRREATRNVGLLLAMLASLILARWTLAGGFSTPLIPAKPAPPQVKGTASSGAVQELRGRRLYLGGRQPLMADAGGGPLRPLPIGMAGPTSVLRQGRYLVVRVAEPMAMVDGGVLVRDLRMGLAVRDLAGWERQRLGIDLTFVDATASLVAYIDDRGDLHLRNLATRRDRVVRPTGMPNWFPLGQPVAGAGCCDQFGAFSANGRRLAIYVQLRRPAQLGLAVVDVGRAEARPVPGSQAATPFGCQPCLGWSEDGWLFFFSGGSPPDMVAAWRPGWRTANPLDLRLDGATATIPGGLAT
jgi:hypothetical protein